jgi:hypothetical protein
VKQHEISAELHGWDRWCDYSLKPEDGEVLHETIELAASRNKQDAKDKFETGFAGDNCIHSALVLALNGTENEAQAGDSRPSWIPNFHDMSAASRTKQLLYNMSWLELDHPEGDEMNAMFREAVNMSTSPGLLRVRGNCFAQALEQCVVPHVPFHQ